MSLAKKNKLLLFYFSEYEEPELFSVEDSALLVGCTSVVSFVLGDEAPAGGLFTSSRISRAMQIKRETSWKHTSVAHFYEWSDPTQNYHFPSLMEPVRLLSTSNERKTTENRSRERENRASLITLRISCVCNGFIWMRPATCTWFVCQSRCIQETWVFFFFVA